MQYDFSLAPGAAQRFEVSGKFFKNAASTGKIRVTTSKGEYVDLVAGQGVYGVAFSSLSVKDVSGSANTGALVIGDFDFRDDTINGTIKIFDDAYVKIRTASQEDVLANKEFMGGARATGTQYPSVLLLNPAGNPKNLVVTAVTAWVAQIDSVFQMGAYAPGTGAACKSKLCDGAASSARLLAADLSAANITAIGSVNLGQFSNITQYRHCFTAPVVLKAGYALLVRGLNTGSEAFANFEFREI